MEISLCAVTRENYEAVCELDVTAAQQALVACNMWSLVEATFNDDYETRAIYLDDTPVGFFMWVKETAAKVSIWRFMVDQHHQQKGIGRLALDYALDDIKQNGAITDIEICYQPNNPVAKDFYASFGFVEMGMDEDDDDMLAILKL